MRPTAGLHCALVYPPLTDPTCGYHSLSYLASAVRAAGRHRVSIVDANIEAVISSARASHIAALQSGLEARLDALTRTQAWTPEMFRAYRDALFGADVTAGAVTEAMATLRDPQRFFDYAEYRRAAGTLERFLLLLATAGRPGMFGRFAVSNVNLHHSSFFTDEALLEQLGAPFRPYFQEELLPRLEREGVDVIGIGVTYRSQLPFALYIARLATRLMPNVRLVLGGTDVSQLWKFARDTAAVPSLFAFVDAVVIGEGEQALIDVLDAYASGREPEGLGILTRGRPQGGPGWGPRYEHVDALPTPTYADLPFDQYLSPKPLVLYSPSRGCYWDRCTFCDYGLAGDRPTSPWRQRSLARAVDDLKAISRESQFVYFSVDVLAPAYLVKLARAIVEHGIDIRWSAELRPEKYFDEEHCALLRESGCVAVSIGFESGNQRVLDLIDKGTRIDDVRRVVRALSGAGIGVQIMGFTGFPSETHAEALESIEVLEQLRPDWVFGGLDRFQLTAGSIVARQPAKFGLVSVDFRPHEDLRQQMTFVEARPSKTPEETSDIRHRSARLRPPGQLWRPFLGGIDTAHTLFYLERDGSQVRSRLDEAFGVAADDARLQVEGRIIRDVPASIRPFVGSSRDTHLSSPLCLLATSTGRLMECPGFVAQLAPLLDGHRTAREVIETAHRTWGLSADVCTLALRFLQDMQALRFLPATAVPPAD